jgi:hypothetical protein
MFSLFSNLRILHATDANSLLQSKEHGYARLDSVAARRTMVSWIFQNLSDISGHRHPRLNGGDQTAAANCLTDGTHADPRYGKAQVAGGMSS